MSGFSEQALETLKLLEACPKCGHDWQHYLRPGEPWPKEDCWPPAPAETGRDNAGGCWHEYWIADEGVCECLVHRPAHVPSPWVES